MARALIAARRYGPSVGYFPSPEKSWCIVPAAEEEAARAAHDAEGVCPRFTRGHRYVGGFVGSDAMEDAWILPQVQVWTAGVRALARVAKRYPQTAYAGFAWSLQAEWTYLLRVSERAGPLLAPVEEAIRGEFLPALLGRQVVLDDDQRELMSLAAKHGGLGIRNPVEAAESLQKASAEASKVLVDALMGDADLDLVEHAKCVRWARTGAQGERREREEAFLFDYGRKKGPKVAKRLKRLMDGSAWLTRVPCGMFPGSPRPLLRILSVRWSISHHHRPRRAVLAVAIMLQESGR